MLNLVKNGEVIRQIQTGAALNLDGLHVSPAYSGWSFAGYSLVEAPPEPEPEPPTLEEIRAAMPELERWRVNTVIDLTVGLRGKIDAAIDAMPEPQRTINRNKLADVQMFRRTDPLFDLIGGEPSIGLMPEQIDAMWQAALTL